MEIPPLPCPSALKVVALVPAHNEAASIAATIEALLQQQRVPDAIVVICDNCTDDTYEIARKYEGDIVRVVQTVGNVHKKSGALNWAWNNFASQADVLVTLDADTSLPPNAVKDWVMEFCEDSRLGGSSSKFTMLGGEFLVRLQRAEFAKWTVTGLKRGWTSVLAGTGCAMRNSVLKAVVAQTGRDGPWSYDSLVEDFELTYQIRELGFYCQVSPTVRAYTDAMRTIRSLWAQRMKWQVGTVDDLLRIGVNRLTLVDWWQQFCGLIAGTARLIWVALLIIAMTPYGSLRPSLFWLIFPVVFIAYDTASAFLIPHRDKRDILMAATLLPQELFAWMRAGWFIAAWLEVLHGRLTRQKKDRWSLQYAAEGGEK